VNETAIQHKIRGGGESLQGRGRQRRCLLGALALLAVPGKAAEALQVIVQGPETNGDNRNDHYWEVLQVALEKTRSQWGDFRLTVGASMNGLRAVEELQQGNLNMIVRSTSKELERQFRPIRIPLDKGLRGYRVFLIRRQLQAKLDQVRTLADLKRFSIGQQAAWNDVEVLEKSGFNVVKGGKYDGLFGMLANGRFDLFSRSVTEVGDELRSQQARYPDLAVERNLLLYYPIAPYLFVRRDAGGEQLALRIEAGLNIMLKDGSFDKMFNVLKAPVEQELNMAGRRIIRIPNPLLSPETPLRNSDLWFTPGK
jgi:hypothetical protein